MPDLVIFGTGDIARLAHFYFGRDTDLRVVAFTVDASHRDAGELLGLPLVDFESVERRFPPSSFGLFVALGYTRMNRLRAERYERAKEKGYSLASYVSPRCTWLAESSPGDNCFILEDATVQPFVRVGNDVTLWSGTHIGHDAVIEDHCFLAPRVAVSGRVRIGPFCFVGINATLRNAITVAPGTLIGAGALIMKDTEENGVYVPRRTDPISRKSFDVKI